MLSPCKACKGTGWHDGKRCKAAPTDPVEGRDLDRCVYGLMLSPWWTSLVTLSNAADISPIAGWPDAWSCGTVSAMTALRNARMQAEAREAKRAQTRSRL